MLEHSSPLLQYIDVVIEGSDNMSRTLNHRCYGTLIDNLPGTIEAGMASLIQIQIKDR